jgi:predicted anti-sigma-YlaC factor YlaD
VRCSSFEPLLDAFVDGTLRHADRARVYEHVDGCERCRTLLHELRVVDALLLTPRQLEPAPNFTFKTMAEVRALLQPHGAHTHAVGVFAAYLAFAWTIIGLWLAFAGGSAREALAMAGAAGRHYAGAFGGLIGATSALFGHATPGVTALMIVILVLDVLVGAAFAFAYVVYRMRLSSQPALLENI